MMKVWQHFKTITRHKWLVLCGCFRVGLYWQGITHDLSKYTPTEFADRLNKDERNNHQKLNRHTAGYIKNPCGDDDAVPYINPIDLVADTTTLEEIEERELKEMLYTYLPKSQADVLWAVAMENVPLTELALREGVSKQAIFNRLTAARKNAKKLFQGG